MKIAVLFGFFNPITNAHVAILKAAMAHIGADRGLFVATNGQYLKKKAVKIGDPFYLTEDERRETIEDICAGEDNLGFGCFELGGITPSRYRTLCKIQKRYPDAQLYEVMGADKVHTLYKSTHAEDYLSRIHFAVFARSDIDTEQMFAEHPVLEAYRSSFVMLPALPDTAAISSTEVRRRFCAGEDYTDLVPEVARLFRVVMEEPEFAGKFRLITFAILEKKNRPSGIDGKYAAFYREFGALEM